LTHRPAKYHHRENFAPALVVAFALEFRGPSAGFFHAMGELQFDAHARLSASIVAVAKGRRNSITGNGPTMLTILMYVCSCGRFRMSPPGAQISGPLERCFYNLLYINDL
jgi:hypothetical protein